MAVSYNQATGCWRVNGRGCYGSQGEATAADGAGPAPSTTPDEFTGTAGTGSGGAAPVTSGVVAPGSRPNPNNPGGISDNELAVRRANELRAERDRLSKIAYGTSSAAGGTATEFLHTQPIGSMNMTTGRPNAPGRVSVVSTGGPGHGVTMDPPSAPGGPAGAASGGASGRLGPAPGFATFDRSGYDQRQADLDTARNTFMSELDRLSGVDPFGNQAFLQKATDRAVAQASGSAAMARGGAAAQAGAHRQAQGIQAQASARGAQEMEQVRSRDEIGAGQLRGQAAAGLASLGTDRAALDIEVAAKEAQTLQKNLDQWIQYSGITLPLEQSDVESLRNVALGYREIDMEKYKTDVGYQAEQDRLLMQKYGIDQQKYVALKQIAAQENISFGEFMMGAIGAGAGIASAVVKSDRRSKTAIRDPDLRDLQDFLGNTKGKLYRYKTPNAPGQRAGENYGPMAQDLQKSKIGRTVVVEGADGLYVDTGRLALADHAALAELARDVERLKKRTGKQK